MTAETVRDHLNATPFVPCTVHLSDGRFFHVDHPDFATVLRNDRTMIINFEGGRVAYVNLQNVTSLETLDSEKNA